MVERLSIHNSEDLILNILKLNCEVSPIFLICEKRGSFVFREELLRIVMLYEVTHLNSGFWNERVDVKVLTVPGKLNKQLAGSCKKSLNVREISGFIEIRGW